MIYFEMYKLSVNGKTIILEEFNYSIGELDGKKRFRVKTPFGFNKMKESIDAYPILHNLLITKEQFDMDLEILVEDEFVHFAKFHDCIMLDKSFAPEGIICYEFSGVFDKITEDNERFLELTREIVLE